MLRHFPTVLFATAISLATASAMAAPHNGNGKPKMFGKGHPFTLHDLPQGRTLERLESLPGPAYIRAMEWLHRFDFPENDLETMDIDDEGAVLYIDPVPADLSLRTQQASTVDDASPQLAASAAEDAFLLHSRPDAANVVYLDFDGHIFSNTAWSSGTIHARAFDLDGNPTSFSLNERNAIAEIWHRVAEDFAAFDIDVTTEEPATFGPTTGRILITSKTDAIGGAMPYNGGGGVAYVNVWNRSDYASYYSPALVYYDNLASTSTYIAEASSHEFGHNLGLSHDGTSSVTYYAGHGSGGTSWAPIMGNSYYNNVTQWSNGEYSGANNTQDDLAIIAAGLFLLDDDHADSLNSASPLLIEDSGQIITSNPETDPHNTLATNKGVIEISGDQDLYYFNAAAGKIDITVTPAWNAFYRDSRRGANLDIQASLLNASGATLAESDPTSDTYANIATSVPAGTYYLKVTGVGNGNYTNYASTGQYFIAGSVVPSDAPLYPPAADFGFGCMGLACSFSNNASDSDGTVTAWSWDFGDGYVASVQNPTHTYTNAGTYTVSLTVTDNDALSMSVSKNITASAPNSPPTANFDHACTGLACSFSDNSSDSDGSITARAWTFGDGNTASSQNPSHSYSSAGSYNVTLSVTDNDGTTTSTSQSVSVAGIEDNEPPVITITSPDDGIDAGRRLTLSAFAEDNQQVTQINIYADGKLRCSGVSSTSCRWNLRQVASGTYSIDVDATDAAGNRGTASVTVNVGNNDSTPKGKGRKK